MARVRYFDDPMTANLPLDVDEAEALAAAPPRDLRDPAKLTHLLRRVALALNADAEQISRLHAQMAQVQAESRAVGVAPTLDASTMLRYVSLEELAAAAESTLRRRIDAILSNEREIDSAVRSMRSREAAVRFAVTAALGDPTISDSLRNKLTAALNAVDAPPPDLSGARRSLDAVTAAAAALDGDLSADDSPDGTDDASGAPDGGPDELTELFT
jgi:hypothetical protein